MADILIIEDSPTDAHAYGRVLTNKGHDVRTAETGERGIELATEHLPDVILMDVVMPGVNGFQATRELHRATATSEIPIIILSTKDQETDRIWGMRQGAVDYLVKPVKPQTLLDSIDSALAKT